MIEKVIYALALLEQLRINGINLIFKGGTCLLLTAKNPKRFSIDIDIITKHKEEDLTKALDQIVQNGLFTNWQSDNDRKTALDAPIAHYKVYYTSKVDNNFGEEPILLDVLYSDNPYPKTSEHPIQHDWIQNDGEAIIVQVPHCDCIIGDKLTAFAPKTTGILYSKGRPVEIIKQLHDLGHLFDDITDLHLVKASYRNIVVEELGYRKLDMSESEVLDDTIDACIVLAKREVANEEFNHLMKGVTNITNFIINRFKIEEAITAAGKVAYLCMLLKNPDSSELPEKFKSPEQIKTLTISHQDFLWLNKLKKINPEAFFYWEKAIALKDKNV
jgi:hypothetical protein